VKRFKISNDVLVTSVDSMDLLFAIALYWLNDLSIRKPRAKYFLGRTDDGRISMSLSKVIKNGFEYPCVRINGITVPEGERSQGKYTKFINNIKNVSHISAIVYDAVTNERLKEKYSQYCIKMNESTYCDLYNPKLGRNKTINNNENFIRETFFEYIDIPIWKLFFHNEEKKD